MNMYGDVHVYIHVFLIQTPDEGERTFFSTFRLVSPSRQREPGAHRIGDWLGPKAGLAKICSWESNPTSTFTIETLHKSSKFLFWQRYYETAYSSVVQRKTICGSLPFEQVACAVEIYKQDKKEMLS